VQNYELILISVLHNQRKVFINAEKVVISCRIASFCILYSGIKDAVGCIWDTCHEDDKCLYAVIEK